jgi:hypothetical protein
MSYTNATLEDFTAWKQGLPAGAEYLGARIIEVGSNGAPVPNAAPLATSTVDPSQPNASVTDRAIEAYFSNFGDTPKAMQVNVRRASTDRAESGMVSFDEASSFLAATVEATV